MRTFDMMHADCRAAGFPCAYWGEHGEWFCVLGQSRDSDTIERSNWEVAVKWFDEIDEDCYQIERESHWAVGWVETLLVDPRTPKAVELAERIRADLQDYPLLDETHHSELEWEEAMESWDSWARDDYQRALAKAYPRLAWWIELMEDEQIDALAEPARHRVNWEYQFDSGGCNYNIDGLVSLTDSAAICKAAQD